MICLDSDFIIDFLNGQNKAKVKLEELISSHEEVVTTSINSLEILIGIIGLDGIASKRTKATRDFLSVLPIMDFDGPAAERTANIIKSLEKTGQPIGLKDSMIAGILLEQNAAILTHNIKHFEKVTGLTIETW